MSARVWATRRRKHKRRAQAMNWSAFARAAGDALREVYTHPEVYNPRPYVCRDNALLRLLRKRERSAIRRGSLHVGGEPIRAVNATLPRPPVLP